jgi:phosphoglycerol transferase
VLALLVVATISMLLFVLYFVADYFTANGINEAVVYHLRYGLSGAGFSEYAALAALALVAALAAPIFFWWLMTDGRQKAGRMQRGPGRVVGSLGLAALSLMLHPATADIVRMVPGQAPALAVFVTDETLQRERQVQEDFERHYFQASARPADGPRKNLVFIYAESLERTYFDETLFPGLMPRLRALESESLSFTGVVQAPGTGWTIAGMVASQCGIPLFTPSHGNSMSGLDSFLPAATCLGDLLKTTAIISATLAARTCVSPERASSIKLIALTKLPVWTSCAAGSEIQPTSAPGDCMTMNSLTWPMRGTQPCQGSASGSACSC